MLKLSGRNVEVKKYIVMVEDSYRLLLIIGAWYNMYLFLHF